MSNGKKFAWWGCLGCGGCLGLVVIAIIIFTGVVAYQGYQFGKNIHETYLAVSENYHEVDQQFPFTPPEENVLKEDRFKAYLTIRGNMTNFATDYVNKFEEIGKKIEKNFEAPGFFNKITGISSITEIVKHAVNMAAEIGNHHVELLEEHKMSWKEYEWLTRQFLGTMAKAENNNNEEVAKLWETYLEKFDESREKMREVNVNTGEQQFSGDDMNRENLRREIETVEYRSENAELIKQNEENLIPKDEVPIIDYLGLQLSDFIKQAPRSEEVAQ